MGFPSVKGKYAFVIADDQRERAHLFGNATVFRQLLSEGMVMINSEQVITHCFCKYM